MANALGILAAVILHAFFLLFGGLLLPETEPETAHHDDVELLATDAEPTPPEKPPDVETPPESPPDAQEVLAQLDQPSADASPALDAASLSALGDALMGRGADVGFGTAVGFQSGGRLGGTGVAGALGDRMDSAFGLGEMDQKPRAVHQTDPVYPLSMRGCRFEGLVVVIFVVDETGNVSEARAESSNGPDFEAPAIEAVRRWKFEPGVIGGKRAACKMRISIRFPVR